MCRKFWMFEKGGKVPTRPDPLLSRAVCGQGKTTQLREQVRSQKPFMSNFLAELLVGTSAQLPEHVRNHIGIVFSVRKNFMNAAIDFRNA